MFFWRMHIAATSFYITFPFTLYLKQNFIKIYVTVSPFHNYATNLVPLFASINVVRFIYCYASKFEFIIRGYYNYGKFDYRYFPPNPIEIIRTEIKIYIYIFVLAQLLGFVRIKNLSLYFCYLFRVRTRYCSA